MTIKEFQVKLDNQVKNMKLFTDPLRIAAFDVTAKMGERIFDDGKKTDEVQIGQYSTKPMYVNPDDLYKKTGLGVPMGKPKEGSSRGETIFKSGKKKGQPHKTKYLAGGYKELRNKLGNRIDFVDLKFSGELRMDFANGVSKNSPAIPRKITDFEYQIHLDKQINKDKRGGMEEKYGTIFTLSDSETENFFKVIQFEFNNRLFKSK